jgi:hypothetical protein
MELAAAATAQSPASTTTASSSLADSLAKIAGLFSAGLLTDAEFSAAKSSVLGLALPQMQMPSCAPQPEVKTESVELLLAGLSRDQPLHEQPAVAAAEVPALLPATAAEQIHEAVATAAVQIAAEPSERAATPQPAAVRAEQVYGPVVADTTAVIEEHGVAPRGREKKKRKRAETDDTDPDWVPGSAVRQMKARAPRSGGTVSQKKGGTSEFCGVSWHKSRRKWNAKLKYGGKKHHLGCFAEDREEDAARAFDDAARRLRGARAHGGSGSNGTRWLLNFPTEAEVAGADAAKTAATGSHRSHFHGVSWDKRSRKWRARLSHDSQEHNLGPFAEDKAEDAARAYDRAARKLRGAYAHGGRDKSGGLPWWLNFPTEAEVAAVWMDRFALQDQVWIRSIEDGCFYMAIVNEVSERGLTVTYPETTDWYQHTETIKAAEVTPERVRATDPLANNETEHSEDDALAPVAASNDDADPDAGVPAGTVGQQNRAACAPHSGGTASSSRVSRFNGVSWHKSAAGTVRWCVQLRHDGKKHYLGYFAEDKEEDAARAFDAAARRLRGAKAHGGRSGTNRCYLNFPTDAEVAGADEAAARCGASRFLGVCWNTSRFLGVCWNKKSRKWEAELRYDGQKHHLGRFAEDKEEDAARAYDTAARRVREAKAHGGRWLLNFPTDAEVAAADGVAGAHYSHFHGVTWNTARGTWRVYIAQCGPMRPKRHYIGEFAEDKEEDAARAYDTAARKMRGANAHSGQAGKETRPFAPFFGIICISK